MLQAAGPLAERSALFGEAVALGIPAAPARLNLRAPAGSASMAAAMQELGAPGWPLPANRWTALGPDRQLVWLGPDEALLLGSDPAIAAAREQLSAVLGGTAPCAITDVSDGAATIRLSGPRSADVLAKGCPLDLAVLPAGAAVQTLLGHLDILLLVLEPGRDYDIHVRSSLAAFAWDWLADAAQEFL
ncbi:MAG: sarcosine oxidase subunit gamma family protein [Sneathiellaceae bacterium]